MSEHSPTPPRPTDPGQRPARPGEVCTCGREAVIVYTGGRFGETGYCGAARPAGEPCPWCGAADHDGRCPAYVVRPDPDARWPHAYALTAERQVANERTVAGQRYRVREITLVSVERLDATVGWVPLSPGPEAEAVAVQVHRPSPGRSLLGHDPCQCGHLFELHERGEFPAFWPCGTCSCDSFRPDDRTAHERDGDPS